jgi:CcmD family protein
MKQITTAILLTLALSAAPHAQTPQTPPKPAAQDEFVPVDKPMNAQETIPAQRLVGLAYGFVWVVIFGYLWSIRRRLTKVERELEIVSRRAGSGGGPA